MKLYRIGGAALAAALTLVGCEYVVPTTANRGYEQNDRDCRDGLDNDADGLVDCEDPDCFYHSVNCGQDNVDSGFTFPEDTPEKCHDFIDNDGDGQFDCADRDCQNLPEACCSYEFTDAACSNGIDDDQNGRVDCDDWSCYKGIFVSVCGGGSAFSVSTSALTGDGTAENTEETCTDGIDNDGNGYTDCNDFSCSQHSDPAIVALCPSEESAAACSDGIDNDDNGYTDCEDYSCSQSEVLEVREVCQESVWRPEDLVGKTDQVQEEMIAQVLENCRDKEMDGTTDGAPVDNDGDGFANCDDFDCSWNPLAVEPNGRHVCENHRVCE